MQEHFLQCGRRVEGRGFHSREIQPTREFSGARIPSSRIRGSTRGAASANHRYGRATRGGSILNFLPWPSLRFLTEELEKMVSSILIWKTQHARDRIPWLVEKAFPDVPVDMRQAMLRACLDNDGRSDSLQRNTVGRQPETGDETRLAWSIYLLQVVHQRVSGLIRWIWGTRFGTVC